MQKNGSRKFILLPLPCLFAFIRIIRQGGGPLFLNLSFQVFHNSCKKWGKIDSNIDHVLKNADYLIANEPYGHQATNSIPEIQGNARLLCAVCNQNVNHRPEADQKPHANFFDNAIQSDGAVNHLAPLSGGGKPRSVELHCSTPAGRPESPKCPAMPKEP